MINASWWGLLYYLILKRVCKNLFFLNLFLFCTYVMHITNLLKVIVQKWKSYL